MARNLLPPSDRLITPLHRIATALLACATVALLAACGSSGSASGSYTIGGTLSGLTTGQTLVLTNGSDTLTLSANGTFTFATSVAQGGSYEVKISSQPTLQTCSLSNATGSALSANVISVAVSCVDRTLLKIGAAGSTLAKQDGTWSDSGTEAAGTMWDCVTNKETGLMWEVKRNDPSHLRHMDHDYTWYNTDSNSNGGGAGTSNGGACTGSSCDTQGYVTAVNATGLCGKTDWRMPTKDELLGLVKAGSAPTIDTSYFPNTGAAFYWSSSPYAYSSGSAWFVIFNGGDDYYGSKYYAFRVRLVRSGQ